MPVQNIVEQHCSALMMAGRCCYIQGNFTEAIAFASEAHTVRPNRSDCALLLAKAFAANNEPEKTLVILIGLIQKDKLFYLDILQDQDFVTDARIINGLEEFAKNFLDEVQTEINEIAGAVCKGGQAEQKLSEIVAIFKEPTYFYASVTVEELRKVLPWSYESFEKTENDQAQVAWRKVIWHQKKHTLKEFSMIEALQAENEVLHRKYMQYIAQRAREKHTNQQRQKQLFTLLILVIVCIQYRLPHPGFFSSLGVTCIVWVFAIVLLYVTWAPLTKL